MLGVNKKMEIAQQSLLLWGNSLADYVQMFDLSQQDLALPLLEIGFGPSSFNTELTAKGYQVVSLHELFKLPIDEISALVEAGFNQLNENVSKEPNQLVWKNFSSSTEFITSRQRAKTLFLNDLAQGLMARRYQNATITRLPFPDHTFDKVLCANITFSTKNLLTIDEQITAIIELCRVAHEVRIFPLLGENNNTSPLIGPILAKLHCAGYGVEIKQVNYELQKGGNAMMRVWLDSCTV